MDEVIAAARRSVTRALKPAERTLYLGRGALVRIKPESFGIPPQQPSAYVSAEQTLAMVPSPTSPTGPVSAAWTTV